MKIQILGMGCAKCKALYNNVQKAVENSDLDGIEIEKVETLEEIMKFGVTSTPALVIDEKVISAGKLLKVPQIIEILEAK
jgi:small redox-active disulfide protein 2